MADPRIISGSHLPSTGPTSHARILPERSEAARAAQRAFFDAAMNKAAPPNAAQPAAAAAKVAGVKPAGAAGGVGAAPATAVTVARTPLHIDNTTPPTRMLRPGSLLDITV